MARRNRCRCNHSPRGGGQNRKKMKILNRYSKPNSRRHEPGCGRIRGVPPGYIFLFAASCLAMSSCTWEEFPDEPAVLQKPVALSFATAVETAPEADTRVIRPGTDFGRNALNGIVHPAVKAYVIAEAERERQEGTLALLVLEAALLIEEHYDEICDELWYIYTREEIREARLMESRGYSREKVQQIFSSQLKEAEYRKHCSVVIDNNEGLEEMQRQIDAAVCAI